MSGARPALLTAACAIACAALVLAEWRGWPRARVVAKLAASAAFVTLGLEALDVTGARAPFARAVVVGLALGALGDAALLGRGTRAFLGGLTAFLAGHLAYVIAVALVVPVAAWPARAGAWGAAPIVVGLAALAWLWPHLGALRAPVSGYVLAIVAMVIAALALARGDELPAPHRLRFAAGALLFFASDLAVARDRFVARTRVNKLWGLPTYYGGQLLIAWSVRDL